MGIGSPAKEQFRNMIVEMRNRHIAAGIAPLMLMREELVTNDDFTDRGGMDNPTRDHLIQLLDNCDKYRRRVTHNPSGTPLKVLIAKAIDTQEEIETGANPASGDEIQGGSRGLYQLPWAFDGTNPNIPLNSHLELPSNNAILLLGAVDDAIVAWSRLNSRDRGKYITQKDSMRIYGGYQEILEYLNIFAGDANRVDVAQVRATNEPRGPENSPNRKTEAVGDSQKE